MVFSSDKNIKYRLKYVQTNSDKKLFARIWQWGMNMRKKSCECIKSGMSFHYINDVIKCQKSIH